eukprot:scaffold27380_cov19-Prasinocladus_malaysianus.AAC.1
MCVSSLAVLGGYWSITMLVLSWGYVFASCVDIASAWHIQLMPLFLALFTLHACKYFLVSFFHENGTWMMYGQMTGSGEEG